MKRSEPNRRANIWIARTVPVVVLGIIGYGSWVITKVLCVDYLLRPSPSSFTNPQSGPVAAILVIYYLLMCMLLICYARLIYTVTVHPGLVPRGKHWYTQKQAAQRPRSTRGRRRRRSAVEKPASLGSETSAAVAGKQSIASQTASDANIRVEDFWHRDVFACGYDGRPAFCSTCYNWKPDRAHHCSELDRCVLKMDHFCPWVGGVVGETSFKFFIQFTFWAALFCTHILIVVAYYLAQRRRTEGLVNAHWAVALGLSGLFWLFSAGMCMSSLQFVFINSTTIENLSRKRKVWYLAVYLPEHVLQQVEQRGRSNLRLITYPRPPAEQFQLLEQNGADISQEVSDAGQQPEAPLGSTRSTRTFAILETSPGTNPFDLGLEQNFVNIMGSNIVEWLLPIHSSPCVRHESFESFYTMGPALAQLKQEVGVVDASLHKHSRRKRSRRSARRKHGDSNHSGQIDATRMAS